MWGYYQWRTETKKKIQIQTVAVCSLQGESLIEQACITNLSVFLLPNVPTIIKLAVCRLGSSVGGCRLVFFLLRLRVGFDFLITHEWIFKVTFLTLSNGELSIGVKLACCLKTLGSPAVQLLDWFLLRRVDWINEPSPFSPNKPRCNAALDSGLLVRLRLIKTNSNQL